MYIGLILDYCQSFYNQRSTNKSRIHNNYDISVDMFWDVWNIHWYLYLVKKGKLIKSFSFKFNFKVIQLVIPEMDNTMDNNQILRLVRGLNNFEKSVRYSKIFLGLGIYGIFLGIKRIYGFFLGFYRIISIFFWKVYEIFLSY